MNKGWSVFKTFSLNS